MPPHGYHATDRGRPLLVQPHQDRHAVSGDESLPPPALRFPPSESPRPAARTASDRCTPGRKCARSSAAAWASRTPEPRCRTRQAAGRASGSRPRPAPSHNRPGEGKGTGPICAERPCGSFAQIGPVPFFPPQRPLCFGQSRRKRRVGQLDRRHRAEHRLDADRHESQPLAEDFLGQNRQFVVPLHQGRQAARHQPADEADRLAHAQPGRRIERARPVEGVLKGRIARPRPVPAVADDRRLDARLPVAAHVEKSGPFRAQSHLWQLPV